MFGVNRKPFWIQIAATVLLFFAGDAGDYILESVRRQDYYRNCPILHGLIDGLTHASIGVLGWVIMDPSSVTTCPPSIDILYIALGSSIFIDIDHFFAARSFRMSQAVAAPHRGILHCSTLLLIIAIGCQVWNESHIALLLLMSFIPHHLRDATRRGLYLSISPEFHSRPIPGMVVKWIHVSLPWILWFLRQHSSTNLKYLNQPLSISQSTQFIV